MGRTLYDKVFDLHRVRELDDGYYQLFVGLHLVHEATSPQAFAMLRDRGLQIAFPGRTVLTADHVIPTREVTRPYSDPLGEAMISELERNARLYDLRYFSPERGEYGIVHVIGPEYGLTQPGMTIACGDSHTSTHGAFGALAFGIGTSQVRDVLATQTVAMRKLKVRRIEINGTLGECVSAKDVILYLIHVLGPKGGVGYAYELAGTTVEAMSMDERMTICNMSVEAGARCGYVNPDETTFAYLRGRPYAPDAATWDRAVEWWKSLRSDADAVYDDVVHINAADIPPMVTWGIDLGQSAPITGAIPSAEGLDPADREAHAEALRYMGVEVGQPLQGTPIDVAFIGSCTNGRVSDFLLVADALSRSGLKVAPGVQAIAVPGSNAVREELIKRGIDRVLTDAGFEFRYAGCSMCLAMNTDKLVGRQHCASSSNRNFKGRQGSPTGRTSIMSPLAVAAAAVSGHIADPRQVFGAPVGVA